MGNIFSSSCRSCCDKYEGLDETNTKNDERSSVDGNQPIESTEYTNLVTMTAKFVYIDRPRDLTRTRYACKAQDVVYDISSLS